MLEVPDSFPPMQRDLIPRRQLSCSLEYTLFGTATELSCGVCSFITLVLLGSLQCAIRSVRLSYSQLAACQWAITQGKAQPYSPVPQNSLGCVSVLSKDEYVLSHVHNWPTDHSSQGVLCVAFQLGRELATKPRGNRFRLGVGRCHDLRLDNLRPYSI